LNNEATKRQRGTEGKNGIEDEGEGSLWTFGRVKGFRKAFEVHGPHANEATAWAIDIGDKEERYGKNDRQNQQ
jgi:hypothetical protein